MGLWNWDVFVVNRRRVNRRRKGRRADPQPFHNLEGKEGGKGLGEEWGAQLYLNVLFERKRAGKESFPCGSDGKESACNAGDLSSIFELGRSPGEENGNPLQYSCLENSMDRGTWRAPVHGVAKRT